MARARPGCFPSSALCADDVVALAAKFEHEIASVLALPVLVLGKEIGFAAAEENLEVPLVHELEGDAQIVVRVAGFRIEDGGCRVGERGV